VINLIDEGELARLCSLVCVHPDGKNTIVLVLPARKAIASGHRAFSSPPARLVPTIELEYDEVIVANMATTID
jgi:hypothetical protein